MAGAGLLSLLDDMTKILDDVAALSKVAAKKTAGIVGDDLAVNANQLVGIDPKRELPIVWAVAKGSLVNKAILIPIALGLSAFAPWAITPLLMLGGAFLCYEGAEKIFHKDKHHHHASEDVKEVMADAKFHHAEEQKKIKSAIWTDFILSAEIVAVSLATVAAAPFLAQVLVLGGIGLGMTLGVYGLVAGIVKADDAGLHFMKYKEDKLTHKCARGAGSTILATMPWLMKGLSIGGTAAMFMVGGGILAHGAELLLPHLAHAVAAMLPVAIPGVVATMGLGLAVGLVAIPVVKVLTPVLAPVVAPAVKKAAEWYEKIKAPVSKALAPYLDNAKQLLRTVTAPFIKLAKAAAVRILNAVSGLAVGAASFLRGMCKGKSADKVVAVDQTSASEITATVTAEETIEPSKPAATNLPAVLANAAGRVPSSTGHPVIAQAPAGAAKRGSVPPKA